MFVKTNAESGRWSVVKEGGGPERGSSCSGDEVEAGVGGMSRRCWKRSVLASIYADGPAASVLLLGNAIDSGLSPVCPTRCMDIGRNHCRKTPSTHLTGLSVWILQYHLFLHPSHPLYATSTLRCVCELKSQQSSPNSVIRLRFRIPAYPVRILPACS